MVIILYAGRTSLGDDIYAYLFKNRERVPVQRMVKGKRNTKAWIKIKRDAKAAKKIKRKGVKIEEKLTADARLLQRPSAFGLHEMVPAGKLPSVGPPEALTDSIPTSPKLQHARK
ncbi:MAG: hypothetical protein JEY79_14500 [Pseudodesulfovibrio sp.]|nr:hypothetical protein [Pseudodesulfovibrio sp.]